MRRRSIGEAHIGADGIESGIHPAVGGQGGSLREGLFLGLQAPSPCHQDQRRLRQTHKGECFLFRLSFELGENLQRLFFLA